MLTAYRLSGLVWPSVLLDYEIRQDASQDSPLQKAIAHPGPSSAHPKQGRSREPEPADPAPSCPVCRFRSWCISTSWVACTIMLSN